MLLNILQRTEQPYSRELSGPKCPQSQGEQPCARGKGYSICVVTLAPQYRFKASFYYNKCKYRMEEKATFA